MCVCGQEFTIYVAITHAYTLCARSRWGYMYMLSMFCVSVDVCLVAARCGEQLLNRFSRWLKRNWCNECVINQRRKRYVGFLSRVARFSPTPKTTVLCSCFCSLTHMLSLRSGATNARRGDFAANHPRRQQHISTKNPHTIVRWIGGT